MIDGSRSAQQFKYRRTIKHPLILSSRLFSAFQRSKQLLIQQPQKQKTQSIF
ncbi:hypothetical protein LBWT_X1430 (plasmid) [Leptolyngbya boryana IAM M-101]|nr:hypothetical protein LBWT_X1430 [Leptolyngbya boryana IAM M-101]BAS66419.1 hypothetical protein LBDG_X1430 [Leptolyngbya boryana dg5]